MSSGGPERACKVDQTLWVNRFNQIKNQLRTDNPLLAPEEIGRQARIIFMDTVYVPDVRSIVKEWEGREVIDGPTFRVIAKDLVCSYGGRDVSLTEFIKNAKDPNEAETLRLAQRTILQSSSATVFFPIHHTKDGQEKIRYISRWERHDGLVETELIDITDNGKEKTLKEAKVIIENMAKDEKYQVLVGNTKPDNIFILSSLNEEKTGQFQNSFLQREKQVPLFQPESPILQTPLILMFRNTGTRTKTQTGLIFEVGEKKQEVQQKPPAQEVPIEANFFQPEPLSMFQIIEKSAEKPERELVVELPSHTAEVEALVSLPSLNPNVEKPAQNSAIAENHVVFPAVEVKQPQVKKENKQSLSLNEVIPLEPVVEVGQELVGIIVEEEMVKKEVVKERITIPLIEIPAPQSTENNLQIQTQVIEVEIEPVDKNQTGINEMLAEITQPASQEIENEEIQEDVGPTEQKEPKIFAVEEFKVKPLSYIDISIYENSKQELKAENLEIEKLVWVVKPQSRNHSQPAILELEFSKDPDPNKAALRFLHFLRKVARKVVAQKFGNDILRTRKIKMIRADEPVEVIRKIEYYLELLRGTYAQVFAFVS